MPPEHDYVLIHLVAPFNHVCHWFLGHPGFMVGHPNWTGRTDRDDMPELSLFHFSVLKQFPLETIHNSTMRDYNPIAKYNHLTDEGIPPVEASAFLPMGCEATVVVGAFRSLWEPEISTMKRAGALPRLIEQIESGLK